MNETGIKICDRCGKQHPTPWQHKGDCGICYRPARAKALRDYGMCDACHDRALHPSPEVQAELDRTWNPESVFGRSDGRLDV